MHDPLTVAFEIKYPWRTPTPVPKLWPHGYRRTFITIWHKDPERDGTDDSCDWFNQKRKLTPALKQLQEATWHLERLLDNTPHYPDSAEHLAFQPVNFGIRELLHQPSRTHFWQLHPRWHFWHWRIQVHPLQLAWRWLFRRCAVCKGRFAYNEEVIGSWSGDKIWHDKCDKVLRPNP